jgi:hypothetical protein
MKEQRTPEREAEETSELGAAIAAELGSSIEFASSPILPPASGLYVVESPLPMPPVTKEELRLDVDERYPQMTASGTIQAGISSRIHWIADLTATGATSWTGSIWFKDGPTLSFRYTDVAIQVTRSFFPSQRKATVTFSGGGAVNRIRKFAFKSRYFHEVDFEFDFAEGERPLTAINTGAHPNRPPTLQVEDLTIKNVFKRAGLLVTTSRGGRVPLTGAGPDAVWSDNEMHDAMQVYWSRFGAKAQWAFWTFFASLHESGGSLGGIMFDDIGPNQRQGTAIFNDSFIATPPAGDPNPTSWVDRMVFWTACHEMGHAFNLAHSWQKALISGGLGPWIPLTNQPEARSFMNYPFRVAGGQSSFFADFEFRFGDDELLFMRHAPERFVRMGDALWFDHHGFNQANVSPEPSLKLELRVNREQPTFEFMEPPMLELKLTNISPQPQTIPANLLSMQEQMTVIVKRQGAPARQFAPYARYCFQPQSKVLQAGDKVYESLFVSAGLGGWAIDEPGNYQVQVALHLEREDVVSNAVVLRVTPPRGYDEEVIAQDFFSDDVGRILNFDGSRYLTKGNDVLRQITDQLSGRRVAIHAGIPLGKAVAREYKLLDLDRKETDELTPAAIAGGEIRKLAPAYAQDALTELSAALTANKQVAAETLGHIDYKYYVDAFSKWLSDQGEHKEAAALLDGLYETLSTRGVIQSVLQEIKVRRDGSARAAGA